MKLIASRENRPLLWAKFAGARVRANGGDAMEQAKAAIDAAFGYSAIYNGRKCRAETMLTKGPHHLDVRMLYGKLAMELPGTLNEAIARLRSMEWKKREAVRNKKMTGYYGPNNIVFTVDQMNSAMIVLRWLRKRLGGAQAWPFILDAVTTPTNLSAPAGTVFIAMTEMLRQPHQEL